MHMVIQDHAMGKARSSTSSDVIRDKTSMMAMHANVEFMLMKLRLKADMPYYVALDMLKEV